MSFHQLFESSALSLNLVPVGDAAGEGDAVWFQSWKSPCSTVYLRSYIKAGGGGTGLPSLPQSVIFVMIFPKRLPQPFQLPLSESTLCPFASRSRRGAMHLGAPRTASHTPPFARDSESVHICSFFLSTWYLTSRTGSLFQPANIMQFLSQHLWHVGLTLDTSSGFLSAWSIRYHWGGDVCVAVDGVLSWLQNLPDNNQESEPKTQLEMILLDKFVCQINVKDNSPLKLVSNTQATGKLLRYYGPKFEICSKTRCQNSYCLCS